jgi:hypothetical protein
MKTLLIITAVLEAGTGVGFLAAPSLMVQGVLGSPLDLPGGLVICRVLGGALLSLGAACWLARGDAHSRAAAGLIAAMLVYNTAAALVLGHARIGLGMPGIGLLPGGILHTALAVWCVACLRRRRRNVSATNERHDKVG